MNYLEKNYSKFPFSCDTYDEIKKTPDLFLISSKKSFDDEEVLLVKNELPLNDTIFVKGLILCNTGELISDTDIPVYMDEVEYVYKKDQYQLHENGFGMLFFFDVWNNSIVSNFLKKDTFQKIFVTGRFGTKDVTLEFDTDQAKTVYTITLINTTIQLIKKQIAFFQGESR